MTAPKPTKPAPHSVPPGPPRPINNAFDALGKQLHVRDVVFYPKRGASGSGNELGWGLVHAGNASALTLVTGTKVDKPGLSISIIYKTIGAARNTVKVNPEDHTQAMKNLLRALSGPYTPPR